MNDAEIIKALPQITYGGRCTKCEYGIYSGDDRCGIKGCKIARDALDLIRRQKAEIEKLKKDVIDIDNFLRNLCKERLLNGNKIATFEDLQSYINKQKSEVIREFAEKLKNKSELMALSVYAKPERAVFIDDIDKLVKIAGGEENES